MSQMDIGGAILASEIAQGRVVTAHVNIVIARCGDVPASPLFIK